MPLCIYYNIIQTSAAASHSGVDSSDLIFYDSAAKIGLNSRDGLDYVDFKGISRLRLIYVDLRLQEAPQGKV